MCFYLYGSSGHAKVIMDIAGKAGIKVTGLIDDNPKLLGNSFYGVDVTGSGEAVKTLRSDSEFLISIGNNRVRKVIAERLSVQGFTFRSLVHPVAELSSSVTIGDGTSIMAGAIVNADTVIGNHVIINTNASVDHDCRIGDYVHIAPGTSICGGITIGTGTLIGAGSTIIPGIEIGTNCTVGAGSVVTKNLPDGCTAVGVPARIVKSANI